MTAQCLGTGTSSTVACSLCPPAEARRRELSWEWWKGRKAALSLLHLSAAAAHSSAAAFAPSGIDHHHHHQWSPKQWCSIESALMRPLLQAIGYSGDGNGKERGREKILQHTAYRVPSISSGFCRFFILFLSFSGVTCVVDYYSSWRYCAAALLGNCQGGDTSHTRSWWHFWGTKLLPGTHTSFRHRYRTSSVHHLTVWHFMVQFAAGSFFIHCTVVYQRDEK